MRKIDIRDMKMSAQDFHRSIYLGWAQKIKRKLNHKDIDVDKMTTEEAEAYVNMHQNVL